MPLVFLMGSTRFHLLFFVLEVTQPSVKAEGAFLWPSVRRQAANVVVLSWNYPWKNPREFALTGFVMRRLPDQIVLFKLSIHSNH